MRMCAQARAGVLSAKRWYIGYIYFKMKTKSPEMRGNHGVDDVTDRESHRLQPCG